MNGQWTKVATLVAMLVLVAASFSPIGSASVKAASGYQLPYPKGVTYYVTQAWATGTRPHSSAYGTTNAVDFAMPEGSTVVAARGGTVRTVVAGYSACGGSNVPSNYVVISHGDGTEAWYVHIKSALVSAGQQVWQGQTIATSGKVGYTSCGPHLHFHVLNAQGERIKVTFDDAGDIQGGSSYTSGNRLSFRNGSSRLYFDQNGERINLEVCADNLPGNTVFARLNRSGRTWEPVSLYAGGRCVTFYDLDGAGPTFTNTTYYSRASLADPPDMTWPIPCGRATNTLGLCDSASR